MSTVRAGRALDETVEPLRTRSSARPAPAGLLIGGIVVAAATLIPAWYLVVRAWDVSDPVAVLTEARTLGLLGRTMALTVTVAAASIAIGVPLAWLTTRTDLPGRRTITVLASLPLVIPSYVGAFTVIAALGPRGLLADLLGVRLPEIYGFFGAWLTLTLFTYPYVLLTVRAAIIRLDPSLEEAARSLGQTRPFRSVVLPQLRPAIMAGGLLVALYTLHDFGAVSLLRFDSFTRGIYLSYSASFDRSRAALLGLMLVALTVVVVAIESKARGRAAYFRAHGTAARPAPVQRLGAKRWPAFAACVAVIVLGLGMPAGVLGYWLARSARGAAWAGVWPAALHSAQASASAAALAVAAAWPIAVLTVRHPGARTRAIERTTFIAYALPGIVVALSLVSFGVRVVPALYQTLGMLVFAYVVLFLPQATGALRASLLQLPPSMEDAARALGARRGRVLARVILPNVRPGLMTGIALVFLTAMKELPATLLLAPTGYRTLATKVWASTSASFFDKAAPPALMLIVLACVPLTVLMMREGDGRRSR